MDFAYDARTEELRERLTRVHGRATSTRPSRSTPSRWRRPRRPGTSGNARRSWPSSRPRRAAAACGTCSWPASPHTENLAGVAGLTNLQYAPLAEITGHSPALAPEALNCAAPDTGNMELLAEFGTAAQRDRWLRPLLDGEIRSAFCMTEPDVASSDATNIATSIRRRGDDYVINGTQVVVVGGDEPRLRDPHRDGPHRRRRAAAQAAVDDPGARGPRPGACVKRGMHVFGYDRRRARRPRGDRVPRRHRARRTT